MLQVRFASGGTAVLVGAGGGGGKEGVGTPWERDGEGWRALKDAEALVAACEAASSARIKFRMY